MYEKHGTFVDPDNLNEKLWRYIDFTKLVSMLLTQSLHFVRADQFQDPFEGSYSLPSIERYDSYLAKIEATENLPPQAIKNLRDGWKNLPQLRESQRLTHAVNCWHLNQYESAAMWSLYLKSNEGIAIQSTYQRFCRSFHETSIPVFIGKVRYIDYEIEAFNDPGNMFSAFLHKRKSFEHEHEVRAIVTHDKTPGDYGQYVPTDLGILIEAIHIAPNAPAWFFQLVKVTLDRFDISVPVLQSDLVKKPLY